MPWAPKAGYHSYAILKIRVHAQLDSILDGRGSSNAPCKGPSKFLVGEGFSDLSSIRHGECVLNELKARYEAIRSHAKGATAERGRTLPPQTGDLSA